MIDIQFVLYRYRAALYKLVGTLKGDEFVMDAGLNIVEGSESDWEIH